MLTLFFTTYTSLYSTVLPQKSRYTFLAEADSGEME